MLICKEITSGENPHIGIRKIQRTKQNLSPEGSGVLNKDLVIGCGT